MLMYGEDELIPVGYTDSDFMSDIDLRKSKSGRVFTLKGGTMSWRSIKQKCITDSITEAEYVATCEAAKEAVWLKKFLIELGVVPALLSPIHFIVIIVGQWHSPRIQETTGRESTSSENII